MMRFAYRMRQARKFWKSLRPEQREMKKHRKYEMIRTLLPLKARFKFERAVLISMLMDTNITEQVLRPQIEKVVAAKIACKRAHIQFHLRFFNTLDGHQRVSYGLLMMAKWKAHKRIKKRAMRWVRRFNGMVYHYMHKMKRFSNKVKARALPKVAPAAPAKKVQAAPAKKAKHKHFFAASKPVKAAPVKAAPVKAAPVKKAVPVKKAAPAGK